ncbi:SGNH/GDSL hydrolase family protein [Ruminococcus sp. HUN007]|uniref:SGNH/GDSL hydrolase family protein n=1 Tax=Ruminococcus sp. HUN007 TaxID=1514668 RepID=UPI0005D1D209|nr:SGNH/GDSL hydrolase family protein [Ruminococcus sp. HUN007]
MKIDKYRRRQITALLLLIVIIAAMVNMVKCTAKVLRNKDKPGGLIESSRSESSVTEEKEESEPEAEDLSYSEIRSTLEFRPEAELPLESVLLAPDDVSLINEKYLDDVTVIGDSICKGYSVYGRLKEDNVLAVGSIGVRNVLESSFTYQGYELGITDILQRKKPKYIFVSLGMNDINIRTAEQYSEDYKKFINEIRNASPESVVIACAITPVSRQTTFTKNETIDQYNEALRKLVFDLKDDKVFYVNAARYLKGSDNYLIQDFSSGDGIHLAAEAYDHLLTYMLAMLEWI